MRPIITAAVAALALSACAGEPTDVVTTGFPPQPLGYPLARAAELTVELDRPTPEAIPFVEELAARCWLDGVVQAEAMIVDRNTGRIVMTDETDDLLALDFIPVHEETYAALRFSGPVVVDDIKMQTMLHHLTHAARNEEVICPPLGTRPSPVIGDAG